MQNGVKALEYYKAKNGERLKEFRNHSAIGRLWFSIRDYNVPTNVLLELENGNGMVQGLFDEVCSTPLVQRWDITFDRDLWSL